MKLQGIMGSHLHLFDTRIHASLYLLGEDSVSCKREICTSFLRCPLDKAFQRVEPKQSTFHKIPI